MYKDCNELRLGTCFKHTTNISITQELKKELGETRALLKLAVLAQEALELALDRERKRAERAEAKLRKLEAERGEDAR